MRLVVTAAPVQTRENLDAGNSHAGIDYRQNPPGHLCPVRMLAHERLPHISCLQNFSHPLQTPPRSVRCHVLEVVPLDLPPYISPARRLPTALTSASSLPSGYLSSVRTSHCPRHPLTRHRCVPTYSLLGRHTWPCVCLSVYVSVTSRYSTKNG